MLARGIPAGDDRLTAEVEGEIEKADGVLFIKSIHVRYRLLLSDLGETETAERAHEVHHPWCPVYKTIIGCVGVTTELEVVQA